MLIAFLVALDLFLFIVACVSARGLVLAVRRARTLHGELLEARRENAVLGQRLHEVHVARAQRVQELVQQLEGAGVRVERVASPEELARVITLPKRSTH